MIFLHVLAHCKGADNGGHEPVPPDGCNAAFSQHPGSDDLEGAGLRRQPDEARGSGLVILHVGSGVSSGWRLDWMNLADTSRGFPRPLDWQDEDEVLENLSRERGAFGGCCLSVRLELLVMLAFTFKITSFYRKMTGGPL